MSNSVIHKKQMTAFERWELASFDSHTETNSRNPTQAKTSLLSVAEIENIRKKAHEEGRAAGYAAGIEQARKEASIVNELLQNLQKGLNSLDGDISQSLLDLSLEIAKKMVYETLQIKPEIILEIVSSAISSLPHINQNAHLVLHPDDAELLRQYMGLQLSHAEWKIFTDPKILRGGCRVETSHTHIDASVEARWQSIVKRMGKDKPWLE